MRVVGITHNYMTNVMTGLPGVNVPYLSKIFRNPVFVSQLILYILFTYNMMILCSEDVFWCILMYSDVNVIESGYWSMKLQTSVRKLCGHHTAVEDFCVVYVEGFVYWLWHMLKGLFTDRDVCWRVCLPSAGKTHTARKTIPYAFYRMLR